MEEEQATNELDDTALRPTSNSSDWSPDTGAGRFCLSFFLYSQSAGTTRSCTWSLRLSNLLLRPKCAFSSLPL